jgi:GTP-binding protein
MTQRVNNWRVVDARFVTSAPNVGACPAGDLPEVAFAGRSNVGKSSLLNALVGRRGLARTSRTPGRTQLLNVFDIDLDGPGGSRTLRCVDLPGYGFVAASAKLRTVFAPMIETYIAGRDNLRAVVLLVDARRGVGDLDLQLLSFCTEREVGCLLVVTKVDKLGASERGLLRRRIAAEVGVDPRDVLLTSSSKGIGIEGRDGLVADLAAVIDGVEAASLADDGTETTGES